MTDTNIEAALARIEQQVSDMNKRLFGNGQPGALAVMYDQFRKADEKTDARVAELETKSAWMKGVGATLGVLLAALELILHFFSH